MEQGVIWGEKIGIRPLVPTDAARLRRFLTDPEVVHLLYEEDGAVAPPTMVLALTIGVNWLNGRFDYGIIERNGRLIGSVRLWRVSERNRSCMLTIFIGEKSRWGQGCGTDALRLTMRQAFGPMGLSRVELHVFDFNQRAIKSYERVGFVREGIRRAALIRNGGVHDIWVMGLLREEFFAKESERDALLQGERIRSGMERIPIEVDREERRQAP